MQSSIVSILWASLKHGLIERVVTGTASGIKSWGGMLGSLVVIHVAAVSQLAVIQ